MIFLKRIALLFWVVFLAWNSSGQNNITSHQVDIRIPEIAMLGLVSAETGSESINFLSTKEAGSKLNFSSKSENNSAWLNYSSIVQNNQHKRNVVAYIKENVPQGISLIVTAMPAEGEGKGNVGESSGTTLLSKQPTEIISQIGSCYTGKGISQGHNLLYSLQIDESVVDFSLLNSEDLTFTVIYTFSD